MREPIRWFKKPQNSKSQGIGPEITPMPVETGVMDQLQSPDSCSCIQNDTISLALPGVAITLSRRLNINIPHEVSIIIPRAEIRMGDQETELIYSSITIVHAPRHPLAGEQSPQGKLQKESTVAPDPKEPFINLSFGPDLRRSSTKNDPRH